MEVGRSGTAGKSVVVCLIAVQVGWERLRCGGGVDVGLRCGGGGTMADGNMDAVVPWLAVAQWCDRASVGLTWKGQRQRSAAQW